MRNMLGDVCYLMWPDLIGPNTCNRYDVMTHYCSPLTHTHTHTHTQVSLLADLGSIGLLFAIMFTPHTPENVTKRLGIVHICIYI